jgi:hypothetical protein
MGLSLFQRSLTVCGVSECDGGNSYFVKDKECEACTAKHLA